MARVNVDVDGLRESLGDATLRELADTRLRVQLTSPTIVFPEAKLRAAADAAYAVSVFNEEKDRDEDSVFARPTSAIAPHIMFEAQQAWLKYKLRAKVDTKMPFAAGLLGGGANASREVQLSDYRVHDATEGAWVALAGDFQAPRTILDLADVRRLQPSEALAIELGGDVTTSITFDVADALSTTLSEILSEVPASFPLVVRTKAGLSVTANVKISDEFAVVISRHEGRSYRFSVRKAKSHGRRFGVDVELGGTASLSTWSDAAVDALFEAATGITRSDVEKIDERIAARVAERLGMRGKTADAVKRALVRLAGRLRTRLRAAVTWKAATAFAYEYSRIEENAAIADYILLDDSQLEHDYALAMSGDLAALVPLLRTDRRTRRVVRYLNEATVTQKASGGFSLGIGRWAIKTRDERVFRQSTRTSLDGSKFITSYGAHKYEEVNVPQNELEWAIELKADSVDFLEHPTTDTLDYGLHYQVELERRSFSTATVRRMADCAAMWDVASSIQPEQLGSAVAKAGIIRIQLLFPRAELEATFSALDATPEAWADALATATPYHDAYAERTSAARRRETYRPVWLAWLEGRDWKGVLRTQVRSGLINLETRRLPLSFAATLDSHPHLRRNLDRFGAGATHLLRLMRSPGEPAEIGAAYSDLQSMWTQRLYVAASGCLLLRAARTAGVIDRVGRTMRIDAGDHVITISSRVGKK